MKATIETVTGVTMNREIDTSDSPIGIIRKFYEDDATAASQIFSNQKAIDQLMESNVDEAKSAFELINVEGDSIRANWKEPLCNQPAIKEELSKIEAEGQAPTFVVSVSSIVAGGLILGSDVKSQLWFLLSKTTRKKLSSIIES